MRVVLPRPDSPIQYMKNSILVCYSSMLYELEVLTDHHDREMGTAFRDDTMPLRKEPRQSTE